MGKWNWIMAKIRFFTAKTVDVNKKSRWFWRQRNRGFKQERLGFAARIAMIQATKKWTLALSKKNTIKHIQPEKKLGFHLEKWWFFFFWRKTMISPRKMRNEPANIKCFFAEHANKGISPWQLLTKTWDFRRCSWRNIHQSSWIPSMLWYSRAT